MLPNPRFATIPPQPTVRAGTPAAERVSAVERAVEDVASLRSTLFSRAAEAQRVTAASVDALIEQLPVGVLLVDRDGRVVYANTAAHALRAERVEPLHWAVMRALLTEDAVREDEILVSVPGERKRWLSVQVTPLRVAELGVTAAVVTVSDGTASHQMSAWNPVIETLVNL
jgi:PAS domain-containing protein